MTPAPSTLPTIAFLSGCAIVTPFLSPLSPVFRALLLFLLLKSKDEVPSSGVSL